jgi:hypothetical protein
MTDQEAKRGRKRPRDVNQLAKRVVDIATGSDHTHISEDHKDGKDPAAVSLGRRGGLKGGVARAKSLSPSERREIAQRAARARWKKDDGRDSDTE